MLHDFGSLLRDACEQLVDDLVVRRGQCVAATKTCAPVKACTVGTDCPGNFGCSLSECYASCVRDTQCATGKTCNTTTNTCQ